MYELTVANLNRIFEDCQFRDLKEYEPIKDITPLVDGIREGVRFALHPGRLKQYNTEIEDLLRQLPEPFFAEKGGGWSFLNMCMRRNGTQWTSLHSEQEKLLILGLASKKMAYALPRQLWAGLPGGMPYIRIEIPETVKDGQAVS